MDGLKLNQRAVDEVYPLLSALLARCVGAGPPLSLSPLSLTPYAHTQCESHFLPPPVL